jgi:hypothetical protein
MSLERTFDVDEFLRQPLMAHLATSSDEGPRHSPVWFLWEEGAIWLIGKEGDSLMNRLRRDTRCAIGIIDFDAATGRLLHLGMRGTTTVLPIDRDRLDRLLARYLGEDRSAWNRWFREKVVEPLDLMARFVPESTVTRDQSYFANGFDGRERLQG